MNNKVANNIEGIVDFDNWITAVLWKPTIVRVYINAPAGGAVGGRISTSSNATEDYYYLTPINNTAQFGPGYTVAKPANAINRAVLDDTLNFRLVWADNPTEKEGTVELDITVWYRQYGINFSSTRTINFLFRESPKLDIHVVLIHYTGLDFYGVPIDAVPTEADVISTLDSMLRLYPTYDYRLTGIDVLLWTSQLSLTQNFCDLFKKIEQLRSHSNTKDLYVGIIPDQSYHISGGIGGLGGGGGGSVLFFSGDGIEAAHEVGHALGLRHTQCAMTADKLDPNYPTYNSYPQGSIGEYGLDTVDLVVYDPITTSDFMSYCPPRWVSPYTFALLGELILSRWGLIEMISSKGSTVWNGKSINVLHLFFRIYRNKTLKVSSAFTIKQSHPAYIPRRSSGVIVELLTKEGIVIIDSICEALDHILHIISKICIILLIQRLIVFQIYSILSHLTCV